VGTGGNKLAMSHRVDNFPEQKSKYKLQKILICPRHRRNFACLRDQSGPTNIFSSSGTGSRIFAPSSSAYTFEQNISYSKIVYPPTIQLLTISTGAILDVVSLEKSKEL